MAEKQQANDGGRDLPWVVGVDHVAVRDRWPVRVQLEVQETKVVVFIHLIGGHKVNIASSAKVGEATSESSVGEQMKKWRTGQVDASFRFTHARLLYRRLRWHS